MKRLRRCRSYQPRNGYLYLLLIIFSFLLDPSLQLAVVSNQQQDRPHVADTIKYSDTSLLVGNLPWNVTARVCTERIRSLLGLPSNYDVTTIVMKPIDSSRPRDADKCHGGSAQVHFSSHGEAVEGLEALKKDPELCVRWAITKPIKQQPLLLDEKTIQRRLERAARYARKRQRIAATTDDIITRIQQQLITSTSDTCHGISNALPVLDAPSLDWSAAPEEMDPMRGGGLSTTARGERKRAAVEAFVYIVQNVLLPSNDGTITKPRVVADLGCGAGNLALPLAWWLRHLQQEEDASYHVLGIDLNKRSLKRLKSRAIAIGLTENEVATYQLDMLQLLRDEDVLAKSFSAAVSLHACGAATDLAIGVAVRNQIPFAVSPCCIGKVNRNRRHSNMSVSGMPSIIGSVQRSAAPEEIVYPRSKWLQKIVCGDEYSLLAAAADYAGSRSTTGEVTRRQRSRTAKQIVELDRLEWAKERGYVVRLMELPRIGPLYSKREVLLGAPLGSKAGTAGRMKQLR